MAQKDLTSITHMLLQFTGSSSYKADEVNACRRRIIHLFLHTFYIRNHTFDFHGIWYFRTKRCRPELIWFVHVRDSSVAIMTNYWLDSRGSVPGRGKRFFIPDRLWNPPAFLYNGHQWLFPGYKAAWGVKLTTHLHLVPRLRMVVLYLQPRKFSWRTYRMFKKYTA
jgi:hypothetical protein